MTARTRTANKRVMAGMLATLLTFSALTVPATAFAAELDSEGTEASVTFVAGGITLEKAPDLNFGSHQLSSATENYSLTQAGVIEVADLRGTAAGWDLTVSLSNFKLNGNGNQTLTGSYISVKAPTIEAKNGTTGTGPALAKPAGVQIDSDGSVTRLLNAASGNGTGVWDSTLTTAGTQLTVFPGASLGTHKATLSWVLQDVE